MHTDATCAAPAQEIYNVVGVRYADMGEQDDARALLGKAERLYAGGATEPSTAGAVSAPGDESEVTCIA